MEEFKRILVINRLAQYTGYALRYGVDLARKFGAELSVMRIIANPADLEAINAPGLSLTWEEGTDHSSLREQYQQEMERNTARLPERDVPIKVVLADREAVDAVMRIVEEEKIDLIVSLAHEEGRLEHLLFGGENDKLIRRLPCSILLVKHEPGPVP